MHKFFYWLQFKNIPYGVKILTKVTAIRWIGWGFAETLIPVFLFSFSNTYSEAGFLKSAYDITYIIALPLIGLAADRWLTSSIIAISLFLYTFVGLGYFLAGATGLVIFVVLARLLNGVTFAMDSIGKSTYIRQNTRAREVATNIGFLDTFSNLWWIIAAMAGFWLIDYFSISQLLLMIAPTSLISLFIIHQFKTHEKKQRRGFKHHPIKSLSDNPIKKISTWNSRLRILAVFNFFITAVAAAMSFFLPIEVFVESGDLKKTITIGIMFTLPYILSWSLGKWFDHRGAKTFLIGLLILSLCIASVALWNAFVWQLAVAFIIGVAVELLYLGTSELITLHTEPEHFGRVGGIMGSISDAGALAGPLLVGALIDLAGINTAFLFLSILMASLAVLFWIIRKQIFHQQKQAIKIANISIHKTVKKYPF